jgi:type IV pilus assembly protein PilN
MIRINLLPVKAAQRRASGQRQILVGALVALFGMISTVVFHTIAEQRVIRLKEDVNRVRTDIETLKRELGDYDLIVAQRDQLIRQKTAIKKLQESRSGPATFMREMSDILTKDKGPTTSKEQYDELLRSDPNAGFNPNWEPKRAWILSYVEKDHQVTLKGGAKSDEDVAEFLKRMKLSAFFEKNSVYWQQTQPQVENKLNNVTYVTFDVTARVKY